MGEVCLVGSKNKKISRNEQKIESYKPIKEALLSETPERRIVFTKKLSPMQNEFYKLIFRGAL